MFLFYLCLPIMIPFALCATIFLSPSVYFASLDTTLSLCCFVPRTEGTYEDPVTQTRQRYNLIRRQYVSQTPPTSLFLPIPSGRRSISASPPGCSRGTLQGRTRMKGSGEGSALHRMRSKNPSLSGNPPMKPATIPITAPWETQRNRSGEQPSKNRTQEPACWDLRAIGKSWGLGVFSIKGLRITFLSVSAHSQLCDFP